MSEKRIVIFTTFSESPQAYSLNRIVINQLQMLLDNGYKPTVIVAESFVPEGVYADKRVTLKRIPNVPVYNEVKRDDTFDEDITQIMAALRPILTEADVVLTHDIVYQPACLKHNIASRKLALEFPGVTWLHWIHSATSPVTLSNLRPFFGEEYAKIIEQEFPNSYYVFFNHYSVPRIAANFHVPEDKVKIVHHPSNLREVYGLSDTVWSFIHKNKIYDADAIGVYPARLDRGKQVEYLIKTMAMMKHFEMSVKVIIVDFHSTGGDKLTYRDDLKNIGIDYGLSHGELLFTSESRPEWDIEVPYEDTLGIMRLANVFVMPSKSESYSLVTQEAGLNGAVMVLNQDFPPFRDIFGPHAIYRKYSSNLDVMNGMDGFTDTKYGPDRATDQERKNYERNYHKETAGMIVKELLGNKGSAMQIFLRKFRNCDYIFKHELEPLFYTK